MYANAGIAIQALQAKIHEAKESCSHAQEVQQKAEADLSELQRQSKAEQQRLDSLLKEVPPADSPLIVCLAIL